jgi:RNA polymerase sigma-70 factor, ECF subfamily
MSPFRTVSTTRRLSAVFRASFRNGMALVGDDKVALEESLDAYLAGARAAWPSLGAISDQELIAYVAARSPRGKLPSAAYAGDVLLACGCARGLAEAVAGFYATYGAVIARVLARGRAEADVADDATQAVYERLLVARAGGAPKLAQYKGTGPLKSWVSTTAASTLLMFNRGQNRRREEQEDSGLVVLAKEAGPELRYMKERYKADVEDAILASLARLDDRKRILLKLHLGERMSIDHLGAMYGVSRATTARWLAAARESLVTGARDEIRARLKLSDSECDSIVALVRSELDVSIMRHLP